MRIGQILRQMNHVPAPTTPHRAKTAATRKANSLVPDDIATAIFCTAFDASASNTAISAVVMGSSFFFNNSLAGAITVDTSTRPPNRLVQ